MMSGAEYSRCRMSNSQKFMHLMQKFLANETFAETAYTYVEYGHPFGRLIGAYMVAAEVLNEY
jgi:hypothetical protein